MNKLIARSTNVFVGADFSQQEPRLLSAYANDPSMIGAYKQGKDLYATIAARIYHNNYWDNMEHLEDGTPSPDGKKRRSSVKSLLLGILYGMGPASLANAINGTTQEAQKIIDDFYAEFPEVHKWIENTNKSAKENGYVEDMWGRRRRLPDLKLPKYDVKFKDESKNKSSDFNPILGCLNIIKNSTPPIIETYKNKLNNARYKKDVDSIITEANKNGIVIKNNGGFIAQAERQCVNARVQGGAATMSKKAMIRVHNDEILNKLGFKLEIAVHDELIGECPKENCNAVADRLCEIMRTSALPEVTVPFKCDAVIEPVWYYSDYSDNVKQEYDKLLKTTSESDAFKKICEIHCECTENQLKEIVNS